MVKGTFSNNNNWKAALMMVLFVTYYANVSLFTHTHIIHGTTIVHSHWHKQKHHASSDGGHRTHEVTLIACLNKYLCLESMTAAICLAPTRIWVTTMGTDHGDSVRTARHHTCHRRAPPAVV